MAGKQRSKEELISLFVQLGMTENKAEETFKNAGLTRNLVKAIDEVSEININIVPVAG